MQELVLDTNMLVAALRSKRGASYRLMELLAEDRFRLNVSVALALEYEDVLKRPGLVPAMSEAQIDAFLDYALAVSNLRTSVPRRIPRLRDPDDELILEVAIQCGGIIVTHNTKHFEGAERFGVAVKRPSEILQILSGAA